MTSTMSSAFPAVRRLVGTPYKITISGHVYWFGRVKMSGGKQASIVLIFSLLSIYKVYF